MNTRVTSLHLEFERHPAVADACRVGTPARRRPMNEDPDRMVVLACLVCSFVVPFLL